MSFASREYEKAIKNGDYNYQWSIISNEIKKLRERQRTIKRAEARAEAEGIDRNIIDIAVGTEFSENRRMIESLQNIREETKARVRAEKKNAEVLPKVKTAKALMIFQRQNARAEAEKRLFRPSERNLSFKIDVEVIIQRMFFKGDYLKTNYLKLKELTIKYRWVFENLGFTLTELFKSDISKNYADYASDTAFDFFSEVIEEKLTPVPKKTYTKDGIEYVDKDYKHTVEEFEQAINEIIAELRPNV